MFRPSARIGKTRHIRFGSTRSGARDAKLRRLPIEPLETRCLLSATTSSVQLPAPVAISHESFVTVVVEAPKVGTAASAAFASDGVVFLPFSPIEVNRFPQTAGQSVDSDSDAHGGLIGHFAAGEGTGAPAPGDFGHFRPDADGPSSDAGWGKMGWSKDAYESSESEAGERVMPPFPQHVQIAVSGAGYYRFDEIVIVGPTSPAGTVRTTSMERPGDASPADVTQQKFPAREARAGGGADVANTRGSDQVVAAAQLPGTQSAMSEARDGAVIRAVLAPATVDARAMMQSATPIVEAAKISPAIFATAVVANVDRDGAAAMVVPASLVGAAASPMTSAGLSESVQAGNIVAAESSGAIVVAQALLRMIRSFGGAAQAADATPENADATQPQAQSAWDAPMFLSANLLGLAPGSPWITGTSTSSQRTLRWVAGVSLLVTVAGVYYCMATTARARRAALDEALEGTLHVMF